MKNQTNNPEATLSQTSKLDGVRLSPHFKLNEFIKAHNLTDQLLTGNGWLHISWNPFGFPRHDVRIGYYK
jgi:hypothetical protein